MKRVVVFGQSGPLGRLSCSHFADRLAQQHGLKRLTDLRPENGDADHAGEPGWVAVEPIARLSTATFCNVDTAIWLHFSPFAVAREWLVNLRARLAQRIDQADPVRLHQLRDSLLHMALTPHVYRALQHPALAHVSLHHLRTAEEAEFWLRAQAQRPPVFATTMQPA